MVVALCVVLFKFGQELLHFVTSSSSLSEEDTVLGALAVIDLALLGSLILIVVLSGYENFVSKIDAAGHADWPEWITKVDFSGLKLKLLASIVLISAAAPSGWRQRPNSTSASRCGRSTWPRPR